MTISCRVTLGVISLFSVIVYLSLCYAADERWRNLETDQLGDTIFYDDQGVTLYGNKMAKVWHKVISSQNPASGAQEVLVLDEFNCKKREYRSLEIHIYFKDGSYKLVEGQEGWGDIQPETWRESLFNIVCKKK